MRIFFAALLMTLGADMMIAATIWFVVLTVERGRADSDQPLRHAAIEESAPDSVANESW